MPRQQLVIWAMEEDSSQTFDCKGAGLRVTWVDLAVGSTSAQRYFQVNPEVFTADPVQEMCPLLKAKILATIPSQFMAFYGLVLL